MPRSPKTAKRKSRSTTRARAKRRFSLPTISLRAWLVKLRALAIFLALIGAVSALPSRLVRELPESLRQVVAVAVDLRELAGNAADVTGKYLLAPLASIIGDLMSDLNLEPAPSAKAPAMPGLPKVADSFSGTKSILYGKVYAGHRETFYCGCDYDRRGRINLKSCGLQVIKDARAKRVEAEHVFPAAQFGRTRQCWRMPEAFPDCVARQGRAISGRECCERVDPVFATALRDLHNIYPANGYVNGQRSDNNWGMVSGGERFGDCGIRVDGSQRRVQPPGNRRGEIARTMLYMRDTYHFRLSRQDEQLYAAWSNADPPDSWEIERNKRIKQIEGVGNRYIENYQPH